MANLPPLPEHIYEALGMGKAEENVIDLNKARRQPSDDRPAGDEIGRLRALLDHIPASCGYDDWVRIGMALHSATRGGDDGLGLFDSWSATGGSIYPGASAIGAKWKSFKGDGVGIGTIVQMARENGADVSAIAREYPSEGYERRSDDGFDADHLRRDRPPKEGKPPEPIKPLETIRASDFAGLPIPPREWLAKDIPAFKPCLLYGDGGTGKSLLALQLACAVVTGTEFFGSDTRHGPAIYLSAEDEAPEMHRRLASIADANTFDLLDLTDLHLLDMSADDAILGAESAKGGRLEETPLLARLEATVALYKPALLILDNLADIFAGNESSRSLAKAFVKAIERLCKPHGTTPLLLAHPSLSGMASGSGTSGSTGWNNAVRSRLYLVRDGEDALRAGDHDTAATADPDVRILRTMKANRGAIGDELRLRWREGAFEMADEKVQGMTGAALAAVKAERVFLRLLEQFATEGRKVSVGGGQTYAPKEFASHPMRDGVTKTQFKSAMDTLLAEGRIKNEEHGPPSRRRAHLVIVGGTEQEGDDDEPAF